MSLKALTVIASVLALCVTTPIWYYLLYKILSAIQATELMWFLFWIYLPVSIFVGLILKIVEVMNKP